MQKNPEILCRYEALVGEKALTRLAGSTFLVVGLGGVGGIAAEALIRCGVGKLILVDGDVVTPSNLNRQIVALHSTMGMNKAHALAQRLADIRPDAKLQVIDRHITQEDIPWLLSQGADVVVDAIDELAVKVELLAQAVTLQIPAVSAMGAGNRLDASRFSIMDLSKTAYDPLARMVRKKLGMRGIRHLPVVARLDPPCERPEGVIGSAMYATSTAGLLLAQAAIDLGLEGI